MNEEKKTEMMKPVSYIIGDEYVVGYDFEDECVKITDLETNNAVVLGPSLTEEIIKAINNVLENVS